MDDAPVGMHQRQKGEQCIGGWRTISSCLILLRLTSQYTYSIMRDGMIRYGEGGWEARTLARMPGTSRMLMRLVECRDVARAGNSQNVSQPVGHWRPLRRAPRRRVTNTTRVCCATGSFFSLNPPPPPRPPPPPPRHRTPTAAPPYATYMYM